jgi:hypothetical protein
MIHQTRNSSKRRFYGSFSSSLLPSTTNTFAPLRLCVSSSLHRKLQSWVAIAVRGFLFLVIVTTCLAARAEDPVQAEFDRVAKMSRAEQQAWLEQLEQRAARVARQTLSPEEAAKQQAHTSSLLHQKMVTWKVLRGVIEDTEAREKAAEVAKPQAARVAKEKTMTIAKPKAVERRAAKPVAEESRVPLPPDEPVTDATSTDKLPAGSVKVNVDELETRIAACNLALRELESELAEKIAWNAAKLEPLADRLKTLVARRNDLSLFRDAVPKKEQSGVTALEPPKSAISQLSAHVVEARNRANDPKFTGDDVERQAELTRLEAISRRVAEMAGK